MKYAVICYAIHHKEITSFNVFSMRSKAVKFLHDDVRERYEDEFKDLDFGKENEISCNIYDDDTAILSSWDGDFEWTWEIKEIKE